MKTFRYWVGMLMFIILIPLIIPIGYILGTGVEQFMDMLVAFLT